jgi:CubicO group peptidase (beta-lactamase class C family)
VIVDESINHDRPILLSLILVAIAGILIRHVFGDSNVSNCMIALYGILVVPNIVSGSETSFFRGTSSKIRGKYLPEFRGVYEEFRKNVRSGVERGAQVVVMFKGKVAVDLYTCLDSEDSTYDATSTQNVWSSTKTAASLAMAMLVDRGLLSYDDKVSEIWPEYGTHGKEDTTVADVLRHEAGLYDFDKTLSIDVLKDANKMAKVIERQKPKHLGERKYHGITRGWILSEIVRRVDGRTMGEFVREEIVRPLKLSTFSIGEKRDDVSPLVATSMWWTLCQLLIPFESWGRRIHLNLPFFAMLNLFGSFGKQKEAFELPLKRGIFERVMSCHARNYSSSIVREVEIPSANGQANAWALAKMADAIVGPLHGRKSLLLKPKGAKQAHENPIEKDMFLKGMKTSFTNAGWCRFNDGSGADGVPFSRFGFTGWMGYGGSVMQWHTDLDIAFGYAMNLMESDMDNRRAHRLQGASYDCVLGLLKSN